MHFTGERMVPGAGGRDELFFEHIVRYAFAARRAKDLRILDAGCGCGYGAHFLRRAGAAEVVGIDIDPASIEFSRAHFGGQGSSADGPADATGSDTGDPDAADPDAGGLEFIVGDVLALPMPDQSFDLVACFEVFEHLEQPAALLAELRRVLKPDGILVVSTPNALTYEADTPDGVNPFHFQEYSPTEVREALSEHFEEIEFFVQNPFGGMGIFPMDRSLGASSGIELRVLSPPKESLWGQPREIYAAAEKCAYIIAECGPTGAVARLPAEDGVTDGRLFAMADDFSDTFLERRALDAYVEQLSQEYGLLKNEQAANSKWARNVLEQLSLATSEAERLRKVHGSLEAEFGKQLSWLESLQEELEEGIRGRQELETYLGKLEEQLAEAASGRQDLEAYLEEFAENFELEREARIKAEQRNLELEKEAGKVTAWARGLEEEILAAKEQQSQAADYRQALEQSLAEAATWARELEGELAKERDDRSASEKSLEEAATWARELEGELSRAHGELEDLRRVHGESQSQEGERATWVRGLLDELEAARQALEGAEVERAKKEAHEQSVSAWAEGLQAQLEEALSALEKAASTTPRELEEELTKKSDRLESVEMAYAELEAHERETSAWATEQTDLLATARAEIDSLRAHSAESAKADQEGRLWAQDLERQLVESHAEIGRLQSQVAAMEKTEAERNAWGQGLEKALAESNDEIERLRIAYDELVKNDARRASWARDLERRLIDAGEESTELGTEPSLSPAS